MQAYYTAPEPKLANIGVDVTLYNKFVIF